MWNPAAVLAALRAAFPVQSGVHIVAWDVGLVRARDLAVMAHLYSSADVVVTGLGLHTLHHVLLGDDVTVIDVESMGVAWEDIDLRDTMWQAFQHNHVSLYEATLLQSGVLPSTQSRLRNLDYTALRVNSDYRVNIRALLRAVGVALTRKGPNGAVLGSSSGLRKTYTAPV